MIKAVFFDLDGVLVDLCDLHFEALNHALLLVADTTLSYAEHRTTFDGLSTYQKMELLARQGRLAPTLFEQVNIAKQEATLNGIRAQTKPDPVKIKMLRGLRRSGYRLACVSNCIAASVEAFLDCAQLLSYFEVTVSNEDIASPKPAADPYVYALQRMKCKANEVLAIEDNDRGVAAAKAAGIRVAQLQYPIINLSILRRLLSESKRSSH